MKEPRAPLQEAVAQDHRNHEASIAIVPMEEPRAPQQKAINAALATGCWLLATGHWLLHSEPLHVHLKSDGQRSHLVVLLAVGLCLPIASLGKHLRSPRDSRLFPSRFDQLFESNALWLADSSPNVGNDAGEVHQHDPPCRLLSLQPHIEHGGHLQEQPPWVLVQWGCQQQASTARHWAGSPEQSLLLAPRLGSALQEKQVKVLVADRFGSPLLEKQAKVLVADRFGSPLQEQQAKAESEHHPAEARGAYQKNLQALERVGLPVVARRCHASWSDIMTTKSLFT